MIVSTICNVEIVYILKICNFHNDLFEKKFMVGIYILQQQINNTNSIMTEFLVQLRQNKRPSQEVCISPRINLQQFKQAVGSFIGMSPSSFQLYSKGELIDCSSKSSTLEQVGIQMNSIIDVAEKPDAEGSVFPYFQYGLERIKLQISKEETVKNIKSRLSDIYGCPVFEFDLMHKDEFLRDEQRTAGQLNLCNDDIVSVKRRILINSLTNGLTNRLKMAESVASGSDKVDEREKEYSPLFQLSKGFNLQKKSSCSASLRNIVQEEQSSKILKHSSIQPYTMHKNQVDEVQQKQNKLLKIEDVKQTMSFGSLEETKLQQIEVELWNQDVTVYYRLTCPFGCKVSDVRLKLAKAERAQLEKVQILDTEDKLLVEDLSSLGDRVRLNYRVNL